MTNGEKFRKIFKESFQEVWAFSEKDFLTWLNAEYREPTAENDLGVDCIKKSDAINIIQDMHGLARADVISDAVNRIIAMSSVTPQEPILDKIRAEIESTMKYQYAIGENQYAEGFEKSLEIIDKYKAESEEK